MNTMTKFPKSGSRALALALAGAFVLAPLTYVSAAGGGGGGGGGGSPSASAPQYDPAEEYRNGLAALDAGNLSAAIKHFKRVTRVAKRNADGQYLLGLSYMRSGNFKKARRPLEAAVRYAPEMIAAQRDLALSYVELERMDDAQEVLATLSARETQCAQTCADNAALDQAILAIQGAMGGEAQAFYGPDTSLLADADLADSLYYQAVGLINDGNYETALRLLDEAALAFGPHPDILTYQGFANRKLARFETAETYYNDALAIAPDHLGALERARSSRAA